MPTPIVLLHGLMGRGSTWAPVVGRLAAYGEVHAPDARGHGRSPVRGGPWATERFAADVVAVLESVTRSAPPDSPVGERAGPRPAIVIGHSMGGLHGLIAAARRPDLVRALVVEDMGVDFRGRDAAAARAWFAAMPQPWPSLEAVREAFGGGVDGDYMAECVVQRDGGWWLLADVTDAITIAAAWARESHWDDLAQVSCPALLLEAETSVVPAGQMAEMARRMPDARHAVVPGSGHLVHAAPACWSIVEPFVSAHACR